MVWSFFFTFDWISCLHFVANNCRSLACFRKGDEGTGEMLTVLFMITSVALNNTPYCPHWYLMTSVILSPRAETAARAENTGCVLETPFVRQPVTHGFGGSSPRPQLGAHPLCTFCTFHKWLCLYNPRCTAFLSPHRWTAGCPRFNSTTALARHPHLLYTSQSSVLIPFLFFLIVKHDKSWFGGASFQGRAKAVV